MRANVRDPLVERLLGPGKPYELEDEEIFGIPQRVFKGSARNLGAIYQRAIAFNDRLLVVQDDVQLTYEQVFNRAASLARALRESFCVVRGTKVAMVMGNRVEWLVSLVAITSAGGVAVLVNSRGAASEMVRAIKDMGCTLAILDAERDAVIEADQPDPRRPRIVIGAAAKLRAGVDADFAALSEPVPGQVLEPIDMRAQDGAVVLFTSGTTGYPRGALISHGAVAHAVTLSAFMGALQDLRYEVEVGRKLPLERRSMTSPTPILGPLFHLGGIVPTIRAILSGATVHIMTKWNVEIAFHMIERVGVSRLGFVPTMLWDMLRSPKAGPSNIGSLLYLSSGSASLNAALVAEIREKMPNCLLANTYGQTETTAWACSISGKAYFDKPSSCGWPVPTVDVRVLRDDGSEADVGEPGELWVRSPALMTEYLNDGEATAATLKDGWCATGDVGIAGEDGIFSIVDRKKNMVISGGENIYCAEVERVLSEHPDVLEAMAFGQPDSRLGERLVAIVVVGPKREITEDGLKTYCRQRLAIYKVPRDITLTSEPLPRTATGKHHRSAVIERARRTG